MAAGAAPAAVAAAVVTIPLIAFALYGALARRPLAAACIAPGGEEIREQSDRLKLLARVEARLAENSDDGRGWKSSRLST